MFLFRHQFIFSLKPIVEVAAMYSTAFFEELVGPSRDVVMGGDAHSFQCLSFGRQIRTQLCIHPVLLSAEPIISQVSRQPETRAGCRQIRVAWPTWRDHPKSIRKK